MIEWLDELIAEQQKEDSTSSTLSFAAGWRDPASDCADLEHSEIPVTNNHSERQICSAAVHRKLSAGNKTEKGRRCRSLAFALAWQPGYLLNKYPRRFCDEFSDEGCRRYDTMLSKSQEPLPRKKFSAAHAKAPSSPPRINCNPLEAKSKRS